MPQFSPGEAKTAAAPIVAKPSGMNCEAELFLGPDDATKVVSSGRIPFVSTGAAKDVSLPITLPSSPGSYHGYIDVFAGGLCFLSYILKEDVAIAQAELILTARDMPASLWSGFLRDLTGAKTYTWGVQRIEDRVTMPPFAGRLVRLQYMTNYGDAVYGPFLIELPDTSGAFEWDASAKTLGGAPATDLAATNNKSRIIGILTRQDYQNGVVFVNVTDSLSIAGKQNVGQYFVGEQIQIYGAVPIVDNRYALNPGDPVEADSSLKMMNFAIPTPPYSMSTAAWSMDFIRRHGGYPDSAYIFSGTGSIDLAGQKITISVSGNVSPFIIAIIAANYYGIYRRVVGYLYGPISNVVFDFSRNYSWGDECIIKVYAHPNPLANFSDTYVVDRWQLVKSFNLWA